MNTSTLLDLLTHTTLKGAAVLLVALLLGLTLRRMAAARRYALWITAIATLAVLPLAMWALPAWHVLPQAEVGLEWPAMEREPVIASAAPVLPLENVTVTVPTAKPVLPTPSQIVTPPAFSWNISWQDVVEALPMVWMLMTSLLLLRLGRSAWRLRRLEASLRPGECALLLQAAHELGLQRLPRLLIGPSDSVPMVWGVLKPRLLLPSGFETWSPEKQRGVLLHELAHLKRGDPLALWAAQWVKALHWFNPLVWLTFRQLRADQERACDDAVLRHGVRASDYAQSLLDLSRHNRLAPGLSLCALTITRCAPVEARVKAILDPTRRREGLTLRWLAGLSACALLITLPMAMLHAIEGPPLRGRILDRNGVVLAESTEENVRSYPLKTLASHVIGYVRSTEDKVPQTESRKGIEKQQDSALREGKDITLTLDARIQALAGRAMTDGGHTRGAVVVLDPRNGAILAMVSLPSYDPNRFAPTFNRLDWTVYDRGRDGPLHDHCVNLLIPPSGAFVPLTALAAISTGAGDQTFDCKPATTSYTSKFECLKIREGGAGHGKIGMETGLQYSCRHYWCQLGMVVGLGEFGKIGQKIGFGQTYGVLELESPGTLPTQEWWEGRHRGNAAWSETDTASLAEGFGYARVNSLQMAVLAATVANAGRVPQPTLIHGMVPAWRADLVRDGLPAAQIQRLREGMRLAVNSDDGAGHSARSGMTVIAGSAGVMKVMDPDGVKGPPRSQDEWFVGFAPYEAPKLAFAILTQEGNNERTGAASVAKRLVEETLALPEDGSGQVPPVEDTVDRSAEKFKLVQFGIHRDEIAGAVSKAQKESGEGLVIKSRTVEDARVTLQGEATSLGQALGFKGKLAELGEKWCLEWQFPVPRPMADGKRVEFRATGTVRSDDNTSNKATKSRPKEGKPVEDQAKTKIKVVPKPPQIFKKTPAKVIGQKPSASSNSLVIDKGSLDGIVANSPVITSVGLVGKTATPEPHTTKVILLTDELCRVSAKVEGTLEQGILAGESALQAVPPQLHLRFLSRFAKITIGSNVYSTGEGGVFPADLLLGRVKQFKTGDVSGEAIVEPAVDFSTLDEVFVIELKTWAPDQEAATPPKPADQAQDADILMDPQLAIHWKLLQRKGFLADLPAKAVIMPSKLGNVTYGSFPFQYTASRADAQHWLANSLGDAMRQHYNKYQPWPEKPGVFDFIYEGFGDCMIHIKSLDAETVEVRLWLKGQVPKSMLIAPDEAAPPQPKTAAPKALSGVASNDTQKRGDASAVRFDFDAGETSRQIKALSAEPGIVVKEFKMGQGKVSILGEASGMIPARKYLFKLLELGKERNVRWALPTIKALENQSVQFEASGTYGAEALNGAPSDPKASASSKPANQSQLPVSDDVIRLQPELAKQWTHLKAAGLLADLPAEAVVLATERLEKYLPSLHVFGFSIPQKEARRWLLDSVFDESQREKILNWPTLSASFNGVFTVANRCSIIVSCLNGGTVYLTIYQMAPPDEIQKTRPYERLRPFRPILIAPDESQEPQPAGRLAPEYHGKGYTQIEAKPTLNVYLQTLRPTITPQDAQLPTFRPQPNQYRVQAPAPPSAPTLEMPFPLNRLHGDLSAESEKALQRSLGNGNRMQQALVVRAPL